MKSLIQSIKDALQDTPPDPLYQRFQRVKGGVIVGLIWYSVEYAFQSQLPPGWYCVIQRDCDDDHDIFHEDSVELVGES